MYLLLAIVFIMIAVLLTRPIKKETFSYQTFFGPVESVQDSSDIYNSYLALPDSKQPPRPAHYRTISTESPQPYSFSGVGCDGRSSHACRRNGVAVGHQGIF